MSLQMNLRLGGHLKTGTSKPANRTDPEHLYLYISGVVRARGFWPPAHSDGVMTSTGRRIRQRRDATRAPTRQTGWRGAHIDAAAPPDGHRLGCAQRVNLDLPDRVGEKIKDGREKKLRMAATSALTFTTFS